MKIIIDKDLQELSEILNRFEALKVECLAPKDINKIIGAINKCFIDYSIFLNVANFILTN